MKFDFTRYEPAFRGACDKTVACPAPNHTLHCAKLAADMKAFKADREAYYARRT